VTPLKMNPEVRARWTAALRSGDYPQTTGALRRLPEQATDGTCEGYCCLGVLTDLWLKDGNDELVPGDLVGDEETLASVWDDVEQMLSAPVAQWAGLGSSDPILAGLDGHASLLNDDGEWTFDQIADAIDGIAPASAEATP
jgi:hypothetical protein